MSASTATPKKIVLHGRGIVGGCAEGEALVTRETISGWGGIDPMTGTIIETRHELRGQSFKDKVLVFPGAKGSSGWSNAFHMTRLTKSAPLAMVFNQMTTKIALGAVVTRVPAVTELDQDPLSVIETGDWVKVDGDRGVVEVIKKASDHLASMCATSFSPSGQNVSSSSVSGIRRSLNRTVMGLVNVVGSSRRASISIWPKSRR